MTLHCVQDTHGGLFVLVVEISGFASPQTGCLEPQQWVLAGSWETWEKGEGRFLCQALQPCEATAS